MRRLGPVPPIVASVSLAGTLLTYLLLRALRIPLLGAPFHWTAFAATLLLTIYFLFTFVAPWRWGLPIATRLPAGSEAVALTFDDGPSPEVTPRVLDALAAAGAKATFFVLGAQARRRPDLIRRMVDEGHCVACHGDTHTSMALMTPARAIREIQSCRAAVMAAVPSGAPHRRLFRPPYGFKTPLLIPIARALGLRVVTWSVNPGDYRNLSSDQVAAAALGKIRRGDIVLLHDGYGRAATAGALPAILAGVRERGWECVSLACLEDRG